MVCVCVSVSLTCVCMRAHTHAFSSSSWSNLMKSNNSELYRSSCPKSGKRLQEPLWSMFLGFTKLWLRRKWNLKLNCAADAREEWSRLSSPWYVCVWVQKCARVWGCVYACVCMCVCIWERGAGGGERERAPPSMRLVQTLGKQTSTFTFTVSLTLRSPAVPPGCCPLTHRTENIALSIWARQRWTACVPINALTLYVCS